MRMRLRFLGTRGEIEASSERHRLHSALLVKYAGYEIIIDCGRDCRSAVMRMRPNTIVLTHAHPDHADGLKDGAPCPVYATDATWVKLKRFPIQNRCVMP